MSKKPRKFHIIRWWNKIFIRQKYKDKLFRKVFQNKKDLLSLYNAVSIRICRCVACLTLQDYTKLT